MFDCAELHFQHGDRVVSLVHHMPEIEPGTAGTIVYPRMGNLYVVELPDGMLHRWFAGSELKPENMNAIEADCALMLPGTYARIINTVGHPPEIKEGTRVKIIRVYEKIPFYDLCIDGKGYHRWLADFELASL